MKRLENSAFRESTVVTLLSAVRQHLASVVETSYTVRLLVRVLPLHLFDRSSLSRTELESESRTDVDTNEDATQSGTMLQRSVVTHSRALAWTRKRGQQLRTVGRQSQLYKLAPAFRSYVEASWLYRWLTVEPEPDVVVIDLRKTITVGPWLRFIQRALDWLLPAAVSSTLFRVCRRTHRVLVARPVQIASLLVGLVTVAMLGVAARSPNISPLFVSLLLVFATIALVGSRVTWSWDEFQNTRGYQILAEVFAPPEPPESGAQMAETPTDPDGNTDEGEGGQSESTETETTSEDKQTTNSDR